MSAFISVFLVIKENSVVISHMVWFFFRMPGGRMRHKRIKIFKVLLFDCGNIDKTDCQAFSLLLAFATDRLNLLNRLLTLNIWESLQLEQVFFILNAKSILFKDSKTSPYFTCFLSLHAQ